MADIGNQEEARCREEVYSEDYMDLVAGIFGDLYLDLMNNPNVCYERLNQFQKILHYRLSGRPIIQFLPQIGYGRIPKCYGLLDNGAMEASGVLALRRQPYINLYGRDVIIGFIDTGIDYRQPVFVNADGTSRILEIWDQTALTGTPPEGISYGSLYTREEISQALASDNPYEIVPSTDDATGHGTAMAGIAAGNEDGGNNFTGVAPLSDIVMVKLKPAKENLREFFGILPGAVCFQETDILMGIRFLTETAQKYDRPLVICFGIGTNAGDHEGNSLLERYLDGFGNVPGVGIVAAGGNEANARHHFRGRLEAGAFEDVELQTGEKAQGFSLELWASTPLIFAVGFVSPSGEIREKVPIRAGRYETIRFLFENTTIDVYYEPVERSSGDELVFMRFHTPAPGIWKIRVYNENGVEGEYHMWLPMKELIDPDTFFIRPDPDITLCGPGNAQNIITTAAYNYRNNSIYLDSSRGYTRKNRVQPIIAAPGAGISVPLPGGGFGIRNGTSIAASICAGICVLLLEWAYVEGNRPAIGNRDLMRYIITGADRQEGRVYPNQIWGYGTINVLRIFEMIRILL